MNSLYRSGYRPAHLPARFEPTSMAIGGQGQAADLMRCKGVPPSYGDPIEVVGFFDEQGDGSLGALTADYPNGKRVEYRITNRHSSLTFSNTPAVVPANLQAPIVSLRLSAPSGGRR